MNREHPYTHRGTPLFLFIYILSNQYVFRSCLTFCLFHSASEYLKVYGNNFYKTDPKQSYLDKECTHNLAYQHIFSVESVSIRVAMNNKFFFERSLYAEHIQLTNRTKRKQFSCCCFLLLRVKAHEFGCCLFLTHFLTLKRNILKNMYMQSVEIKKKTHETNKRKQ